MNPVAALQQALITFASTALTLGIAVIVIGGALLVAYLIARNAMHP